MLRKIKKCRDNPGCQLIVNVIRWPFDFVITRLIIFITHVGKLIRDTIILWAIGAFLIVYVISTESNNHLGTPTVYEVVFGKEDPATMLRGALAKKVQTVYEVFTPNSTVNATQT